METCDVVFVLFLLVGLVVTVYCGAMWVFLTLQRRGKYERLVQMLKDLEGRE